MTGSPSSRQRSTTRVLNPGVTTKRAPAASRDIDLLGPHDRAGPYEQVTVGGEQAEGLDGRRGAKGHLDNREAAVLERVAERTDRVDLVGHDDRNDAPRAEEPEDAEVAHRASQPPSTATIVPHT